MLNNNDKFLLLENLTIILMFLKILVFQVIIATLFIKSISKK